MTGNRFTPFIDAERRRRSGLDEMIVLLAEANFWRSRLVEMAFAGSIFFALGFAIAERI